jgi:nucleoside-diphosphate-sugar epimerase
MYVVTGASGFLGGAIAAALAGRGEPVRAFVRAGSDIRRLKEAGIHIAVGDVVRGSGLREALSGARVVVHGAGMLGRAGANDADYERVHVQGTLNVVREARAAGAARVVHISSPGVLGPIPRAAPDADEGSPLRPTNPYERSKAATETALAEEAARNGAFAVVVRPEFVYGPGDRHVLRLFRAIRRRRFVYIGPGDALCHPTYVEDVVAGVLAAAKRGEPARVYQLAGPRPLSIRELVETIARACGVPPPRLHVPEVLARGAAGFLEAVATRAGARAPIGSTAVDFFTQDRHFSWQRASRELGYCPRVDLDEGARRSVRWYEREGLIR